MKKVAQPILELSNICKSDKKSQIERLDLTVPSGDTFVVLHKCPNNISLLMEILSGRVSPKKGKIFFKGDNVTGHKNVFGIIKKKPQIPRSKTVLQTAAAPLLKRGLSRPIANVLLKKELALAGLEDIAETPLTALPPQAAAKALYFSAYMCSHELIVIDSPFSELADDERSELISWLINFRNKNNISLLIFTDDIDIALTLGNYVMVADNRTQSMGITAVIDNTDKARERIESIYSRI